MNEGAREKKMSNWHRAAKKRARSSKGNQVYKWRRTGRRK